MARRWLLVGAVIGPLLAVQPLVGQSLTADLQRIENAERRDAIGTNKEPRTFEALAALAGEAYRRGDHAAALKRFDEAAAEAFRLEASGAAFEYALVAAELTRVAGDHADAADRFRRAALGAVRDPRAAAAHEAACVAAGESLRKSATEDSLQRYGDLLSEHLATWPAAESVEAIRRRRREWLQLTEAWDELLEETSTADRSDAVTSLRLAAYRGLLSQPSASTGDWLRAATEELQPLILGADRQWPRSWTPLQREAALVLARGHLERGAEGAAYAARLLRVAWRGEPGPSEAWRRGAAPLLVVASLATSDQETALAVLRDQDVAAPREVLDKVRRSLAGDDFHTAADRLSARLASFDAEPNGEPLVNAGDLDYAGWTDRERRSQRGSNAWREARLARMRLLIESGESDEARKLLRLTRLLGPSGDDVWRSELATLGRQLSE